MLIGALIFKWKNNDMNNPFKCLCYVKIQKNAHVQPLLSDNNTKQSHYKWTIYLLRCVTVCVSRLIPLGVRVHHHGWRGAQTPQQPTAFLTEGHFSHSPQSAPLSQSHELEKRHTHTNKKNITLVVVLNSSHVRLFSCLSHCPDLGAHYSRWQPGLSLRRCQHTEF